VKIPEPLALTRAMAGLRQIFFAAPADRWQDVKTSFALMRRYGIVGNCSDA
jgi:hypothetical protein